MLGWMVDTYTLVHWLLQKELYFSAPTGDAPITYEWSTILLPTTMWLILAISRELPTKDTKGWYEKDWHYF